jgi:NADH-quinone oxidoreductase subunit E
MTGAGSTEPAGSGDADMRGPGAGSGLYDAIQAERAKYPEGSRSATLHALRLAQEEHGWLSPDALREVAEALDVTPAYCTAVATFYDMYHLEPVGTHLVEVCTNLSCALAGAQRVVDAFASELGVAPGETTADGEVTFRTVECLGGCGWATIVAVDHHYRTHVSADDVPAIVEELRAGS